jgi:hypothetical protein
VGALQLHGGGGPGDVSSSGPAGGVDGGRWDPPLPRRRRSSPGAARAALAVSARVTRGCRAAAVRGWCGGNGQLGLGSLRGAHSRPESRRARVPGSLLRVPRDGRGLRQRAPLGDGDPRGRRGRTGRRRGLLPGDGEAGEGVHPRGRHLPGRALPALPDRAPGRPVPDLSPAAADQSEPVSLLSALRRCGDHRFFTGDPGTGRERSDRPAPDRRDATSWQST